MVRRLVLTALVTGTVWTTSAAGMALAQPAPADKADALRQKLEQLQEAVDAERGRRERDAEENRTRLDLRPVSDCAVYAKAVEWCLRHDEFFKPEYVRQAEDALATGLARIGQVTAGKQPDWTERPGKSVRGYVSKIDGSVQPYALTLPAGFDPDDPKRWPLYVVLHGRSNQMNEVNFIARYDGKPAPEGQDWIQLDVYGRGNNAYRWAGEMDVFEAIEDVERRYRIDNRRVTLWGFSMGGAGAWHLGLHHPSRWASVGAGAGFVDFYKYQKQTDKLPPWQDRTLHIYDAIDYALNAANVPVITYGGENDPQLLAGASTVEAAKEFDIEIELLVGKGMGHRFDDESLRRFMEFHREHNAAGRPSYPGRRSVRFITYTPKYNRCEWAEIAEIGQPYEPAWVQGAVKDDGVLKVETKNVSVLKIARDIAGDVEINGDRLPLVDAADGLLPEVYYAPGEDGWQALGYDASRRFDENPNRMKRRDLQGPIDDAFMQPFVCVRGTGEAWNADHAGWADWNLDRFRREFDKWMRAEVPLVDDEKLTPELIQDKSLILFGDPGSNLVLAKVLPDLPLRWTREGIEIGGKTYDPADHGLCLIFPNPLNPRRYVVVNSGHTFHEKDFQSSNAWLFPRLGDAAAIRFRKTTDGYDEETAWAEIFNSAWRLPESDVE
jgi:dienelactone hydrolase